ncbi:MAG TPA: N-6 DNA methylase [Pyrinomonadaceae bacterium]|jgi:methylase of polypeptide subunit release factors
MAVTAQRLAKSKRLSIPLARQTLLSNTRRWAEPLLTAHQQLISVLQKREEACVSLYRSNYAFLQYEDEQTTKGAVPITLSSAALILNWLVGRASGSLPNKSSLVDAETWFQGDSDNKICLSKEIPQHIQSDIITILDTLDVGPAFLDIIPYAAEVFETSDEILSAFGVRRKTKKATGVFYTPSDVSDYIVDNAIRLTERTRNLADSVWLDPACGSGSFLLSALYKVGEEERMQIGEETIEYAARCLFGIDVSPIALQSAAYILVLASMQERLSVGSKTLQQHLYRIGSNLLIKDATKVVDAKELAQSFPNLQFGADFVVSNPPYIRRSKKGVKTVNWLFADEPLNEIREQSVFLTFIRMMSQLSHSRTGVGGMVVPLSLTYNTRQEFIKLRQYMQGSNNWRFINFDRTPDSLFGDDVKTRNTIIFFNRTANEKGLYSSDLIRWSSRSRLQLFSDIPVSKLDPALYSNTIPKIGSELGQKILRALQHHSYRPLGKVLARATNSLIDVDRGLRNSGTAYNWLPFELLTEEARKPSAAANMKYRYWLAHTEDDSKVIFAIVQSRLSYWLWRVWGDGFHLTDQFIKSLPLSPLIISAKAREELKELGSKLWHEMLCNKVESSNAGLHSISYCPYVSDDLLDQIDGIVVTEYHLPAASSSYLKDFVRRTIVAGRDDEISANPALRKWMVKETINGQHLSGN